MILSKCQYLFLCAYKFATISREQGFHRAFQHNKHQLPFQINLIMEVGRRVKGKTPTTKF